jgi:hypothetical protein
MSGIRLGERPSSTSSRSVKIARSRLARRSALRQSLGNSRATCAIGLPVSRTIRTALCLKSSSNFCLLSAVASPHWRCLHAQTGSPRRRHDRRRLGRVGPCRRPRSPAPIRWRWSYSSPDTMLVLAHAEKEQAGADVQGRLALHVRQHNRAAGRQRATGQRLQQSCWGTTSRFCAGPSRGAHNDQLNRDGCRPAASGLDPIGCLSVTGRDFPVAPYCIRLQNQGIGRSQIAPKPNWRELMRYQAQFPAQGGLVLTSCVALSPAFSAYDPVSGRRVGGVRGLAVVALADQRLLRHRRA